MQTYFTPDSLEEALVLKARHGYDLQVVAGGTLLMPEINEGRFFPPLVMGLRRAGLDHVFVNGAAAIGATATLSQMSGLADFPILAQAAGSIGGWAVRNMATVGGNLFNQAPQGDFAVALLALDARLKIQNQAGARLQSLEEFLKGGRVLAADELITEIQVARPKGQAVYQKFGRRQANAATIVTVAAVLELDDGVIQSARVALGGAYSVTARSVAAEAVLVGSALTPELIAEAAESAAAVCAPVDDAVASAWYRRRMVEVQLKRALSPLLDAVG